MLAPFGRAGGGRGRVAGRGGRQAAALPTRPAHVWAAGAIALAVLRCGAAVAGDDARGGAQAGAAGLLPWAALAGGCEGATLPPFPARALLNSRPIARSLPARGGEGAALLLRGLHRHLARLPEGHPVAAILLAVQDMAADPGSGADRGMLCTL